jgi:hypothetical protein
MDKATLYKTCDNFARVYIEVKLSKPLALKSWLRWRIWRVEYKVIYFVCFCRTSPRGVRWWFSLCLLDCWESPPSISLRVTRKPGCTGLIRDSRVRDWLWLGKVLAPLTHPTLGKLLRGFDVIKKFLFFHRILEIRLTCKFIIFNHEQIKILNSSLFFVILSLKNL